MVKIIVSNSSAIINDLSFIIHRVAHLMIIEFLKNNNKKMKQSSLLLVIAQCRIVQFAPAEDWIRLYVNWLKYVNSLDYLFFCFTVVTR